MKYILVTLFFSCLFSLTGVCQIPKKSDTTLAIEYLESGYNKYGAREYEKAIVEFKKAGSLFKVNKKLKRYFKSEIKISECLWKLGQFDPSLTQSKRIIKESIVIYGDNNLYQSYGYHNLSIVNSIRGNLDSAYVLGNKELAILNTIDPKPLTELSSANNLIGVILVNKSLLDSAVYYMQTSLNISIELNGENHPRVAKSFNNLGAIYMEKGEHDKAVDFFKKALAIRYKNNFDDPAALSNIYKNLGTIYFENENYSEALISYHKAYDHNNRVFDEANYRSIGLLQNIGNSHDQLENVDSALFFQEKAVEISKKKYGENNRFLANAYNNLGSTYMNSGEYDKAEVLFENSLKININHLTERNVVVLDNYFNLADVALRTNQHEKALNIAQRGILINTLSSNPDSSFHYSPKIEKFLDYRQLLQTLYFKGRAAEEMYNKTSDSLYLNISYETYDLAVGLIDSLRAYSTTENDKIRLIKKAKPVYEGAIRTKKIISEGDNKQELLKDLFAIVQKYKTSSLSGINTEISAKSVLGIPDSIAIQEKYLKTKMSALQSELMTTIAEATRDTTLVSKLNDDLFKLKRKKDSLENYLLVNIPKYYNLKYSDQIIDVEEIQEGLDMESALVEYFEGDSSIYAFIFTKDLFKVIEIKRNEALNNYIEFSISGEFDYSYSYKMYEELIKPLNIATTIKYLTIVPDGSLWNVNFDLLLSEKGDCQFQNKCAYLMNRYNISYGYSTYLLMNQQSTHEKGNNQLLAFSYGKKDEKNFQGNVMMRSLKNSYDKIPGSSSEILAISEFVDGDYFYGEQASESTFKSKVANYSIIHLAIHGETNEKKPNESKLIFYAKDSLEDGNLHAFELYNMSLNAKMAVLSACNSGTGKLVTGEGLMSIGRSFSYAGVPSLVLNRWNVSDVTAPYIMKYFYEGLYQGMRKSEALSYAKKKFLTNDADNITSAPFYWAGFYVLGDDSPIIEKPNWTILLIAIALILLVFGISGYYFYSKKRR